MDGSTQTLWSPNPGPQTAYVTTSVNEALYGGAAGGGKSAALIALPLRWIGNPRFRALILRRESTQLGDLLDKARALYPHFGARENLTTRIWRFPSGATVRFNHCEHESDAQIYDGQEFQLVGFDELTHFAESQYRAIRARVRSTDATLPRYTRATTNPGGTGHEWVFRRFGPWLDPEHPTHARPAEVRWFVGDEAVSSGTPGALSRTFIPAKLSDNPHLTTNDPQYASQLLDLDPVRRAQLLDGNWLVKPSAGAYFKRGWLPIVDAVPAHAQRVRYWDRASTEGGGDWTVGTKMSRGQDGLYYVEDVVRVRQAPGGVEATIKTTAQLDTKAVQIVIEQDPGQAGKFEVAYYIRELAGWPIKAFGKRIDKVTAASPLSSQAAAGNVRLLRGRWNEAFIQELEAFPEGNHDDQVDATSGAFAALTASPQTARPIVVAGASRWADTGRGF